MNGTATASSAGSNRRFIMFALVLGLLGSVLLYTAVSRNSTSSSTGSIGSPGISVVVAKTEIPARTRITASMVEVRQVPENASSFLAYTNVQDVIGQVTRFPITANEHVLSSKLVVLDGVGASRSLSYVVPPGKRGFAIRVSEVANAGGLILPGDYVDVIVIYDIEFPRGGGTEKVESYFVHTLFQNIEVLAVSQAVVDLVPEAEPVAAGQRARNTEAKANPDAATVTLALSPDEIHKMYLAESNGRIRLAVRPFGDAEVRPVDHMVELQLYPRDIPNPFLQR